MGVGQILDSSELTINSKSSQYKIKFVSSDDKFVLDEKKFYIIDSNLNSTLKLDTKSQNIILLDVQEEKKNLHTVEELIIKLSEKQISRKDVICGIGGGVVQDLVTLTSSIYKRGIDWEYLPTTLTAMADSCIGGKSSINAGGAKNVIGNIYPPKLITIDTFFIKSLDEISIIGGISEAVKICFARDPNSFKDFIKLYNLLDKTNHKTYQQLIQLSLTSKKWFIEIDEFDKKERQLLNFGHSWGHAWESAVDFKANHGVAVAVGMLAALNHPQSSKTETSLMLRNFLIEILSQIKPYLSNLFENTNWDVFESSLKNDKKNTVDILKLILPDQSGGVSAVALENSKSNISLAKKCLIEILRNQIE
jgi:3-dehydroquinate synthase